jgi:hypothetical protein
MAEDIKAALGKSDRDAGETRIRAGKKVRSAAMGIMANIAQIFMEDSLEAVVHLILRKIGGKGTMREENFEAGHW